MYSATLILRGKFYYKEHAVLMTGIEPGGVAAKHRGLWSPRREFESLPGYYCPGVNSYFFRVDFRGFLLASVVAMLLLAVRAAGFPVGFGRL